MKCAIVTIAIGDKYIKDYNDIFRKHTEYYCQRFGYAFHLITEYSLDKKYPIDKFVNIMKWTISSREDMQQYDRIAIVDADIIITPTCPPIHLLDLEDKVGVVDEYSQPTPEIRINYQKYNGYETSPSEYYMRSIGETLNTPYVFNGGFCVCSPKLHGHLFKDMFDRRVDGTFNYRTHPFHHEQGYFGYELQTQNKYKLLDTKWNTLYPLVTHTLNPSQLSSEELYNTCYILHFCAHDKWDHAFNFNKNLEIIKNKYNTYEPLKCNVEVICNVSKEQDRIDTLKNITNHYNVVPTYTIYGQDARNHTYFPKFKPSLNINASSLAINHITLFEKYKNTENPLLVFESDVLCLYNFDTIDNKIGETIKHMSENSIDFVFLGKGCFSHVDTNGRSQVADNLYTASTSRCTESYLISPNGIRKYLEYFYTAPVHTAIDADFNLFYEANKDIQVCWLIPELFSQGSRSIYPSLVPITG